MDQLGEVVGVAQLADQLELGFEPVGVRLLAEQDLLEQLATSVVAELDAASDATVETIDRLVFELEGELQLLDRVSPTRTVPRRCRFGRPSR